MKIIATNENGYKVALLDHEDPMDFILFERAYATFHADEQHEDEKSGILRADLEPEDEMPFSSFKDEEAQDLFDMFSMEHITRFVLLTSQDVPAGEALINFEGLLPMLDGLRVLQTRRGSELGKLLIESRLQYLANETDFEAAQMEIKATLTHMQDLARECGFQAIEQQNGFQIWQRNMGDLRLQTFPGNDPQP